MAATGTRESFERLLSPLDLGPFTLRNRMICTGHNPHYDADGLIGDQQIAFHRRKAVGGIALSTTGGTVVHPSGGVPPSAPLYNVDDTVIPGYERLAEAMHGEGARMMVQLTHPGSANASSHTGPAIWSPSQTLGAHTREAPHVMTIAEIEIVLDAFHQAAARVARSGLDGVEVNMFAGGMSQQFLSPTFNRRTDRYGGSFENRLRFPIEMIRQVRAALGSERALALKIPGDELFADGMHLADMQEVVRRIDAAVHVDYYVVASGNNLDWFARIDHWPPAPAPQAVFENLAKGIKAATKRPVAALARIVDPRVGERILAEGGADIIAMVRSTIADPDFVRKVADGEIDRIRPCVGASSGCVDRIVAGGQMRCIHNAVIGYEREWADLPAAAQRRKVVVIGGGPAGMEAARVATERGHSVTLFEKEKELGGAALILARKPGRSELGGIARWLAAELTRLGTDVRLGVAADATNVLAMSPDAIIIAAGAATTAPELTAPAGGPAVVSATAILEGSVKPGRRVLVVDALGYDQGAAAAEVVLDSGGQAELASPYFHPAIDFGLTNTVSLYRRLFRKGVVMTAHHRLGRVTERGASLVNIYNDEERWRDDIDMVVVATVRLPRDALRDELSASGIRVDMIGDCVAPRDVETAIHEGHRAGRAA
jgi:2,4-dienoyl-CoA reductase-like NADH-dependent reductase (Old Yellow Enzyme family)/thioredoxin reductase